jgi:hypothetical protein
MRFRKGNALLEAAMALPVLALLMLGVIDFSSVFVAQITNTGAARMAAQHAMNQPERFRSGDLESKGEVRAERVCYCANADGTLGAPRACPVACANARVFVKFTAESAVNPVIRYPLIPYPAKVASSAMVRIQ